MISVSEETQPHYTVFLKVVNTTRVQRTYIGAVFLCSCILVYLCSRVLVFLSTCVLVFLCRKETQVGLLIGFKNLKVVARRRIFISLGTSKHNIMEGKEL